MADDCARGDSSVRVAGLDLDVVRCQLVLDAQRMGELQTQLNASIASAALSRQDLAKAQEAAGKMAAELAWWKAAAAPLFEPK